MKGGQQAKWANSAVQIVLLFLGLVSTLALFFGQSGFPEPSFLSGPVISAARRLPTSLVRWRVRWTS